MKKMHFQISISTDDATGEVLAVYFHVRTGRVRETREFANGNAFADYDVNGRLLGIELLGPCRVSIVDKIAEKEPVEIRKMTKNFMKKSGPSAMVAA
jgi:uncharacterized protein YuzE